MKERKLYKDVSFNSQAYSATVVTNLKKSNCRKNEINIEELII